jgi:hypothetical protein
LITYLVVVVESDSSSAAIRPTNGKVLAEVTVVLGPELVLGAITGVVAVEGVACVVGGVVLGESFVYVELYAWVACEAIEGKVGIALRIVVCRVIDHADTWLGSPGRKR